MTSTAPNSIDQAEVVERHLDEGRRPEDPRVDVDSRHARAQCLERVFHAARHLERVGAGCFSTMSIRPSARVDDGVADRRRGALGDCRHVADAEHRAVAMDQRHRREVARRCAPARRGEIAMPLVRRVDEPAGRDGRRVARRRRRPVERHVVRLQALGIDDAPESAGRAGPRSRRSPRRGTAISRGRTVHFVSVVSSICDSVSDVRPIFITRLSDDSGGMTTGGVRRGRQRRRPRGRRAPARVCRASRTFVPSSKIITTDDRPSTDFERSVVEPRHAVQRVLERNGDERLDLRRRQAGRFGLNLDERRRELREHVERNLAGRFAATRSASIAATRKMTTREGG